MLRCHFLCKCPYKSARDQERKQVDHAKQLAVRKLGKSSSTTFLDTIVSIEIHREVLRRRKCSTIVDNFSNELCSVAHELNDKEKQIVLRRFLGK